MTSVPRRCPDVDRPYGPSDPGLHKGFSAFGEVVHRKVGPQRLRTDYSGFGFSHRTSILKLLETKRTLQRSSEQVQVDR